MQKSVEKFGISDKRGRILTNADPYQERQGNGAAARCIQCHAVYRNKRWSMEPLSHEKETGAEEDLHPVVCPACRKTADGYPQGVMTLRGAYLWAHEAEIGNLLRHAEERSQARNPLERIIRMERAGESLLIETTTEKLAEHLGRVLHKAHHGELHLVWNDGHDACRVEWSRG